MVLGYHIQGDHLQTIPYLYHGVCEGLKAHPLKVLQEPDESESDFSAVLERVEERSPQAAEAIQDLLGRRPYLKDAAPSLCKTYLSIAESFDRGGNIVYIWQWGKYVGCAPYFWRIIEVF